ncbi:Integrase, site-specific recombinase [Fulvivirga imtechensis AK7]|uniref:Integrase, site-specific recombinase n=1 Tax=Fulvivirga imtechensis AK7 TaxID=1237149 RepID=L8JVS4_9BACT|nr:tyrosine-type recombinase/integrase [Fulvivirga imtechensis]ELR71714.1 Integrase, site-specific recombinase [Fulvivirga imtechensis AK7]
MESLVIPKNDQALFTLPEVENEITYFLDHLAFVKRYSSHTITAYKTDLLQFQRFFKQSLLLATHRDVREFLMWLVSKGYSLNTVNRKLEVLKSFYRYYWRHGYIEASPCWKLRHFQYSKRRGKFIPVDNIINVLDNINPGENIKLIRDQLILELLYYTGCRASEIINLQKQNINYCKGEIKVTGKGKRERIVFVNSKIIDLIKTYRSKCKHGDKGVFLFCSDKGQQIYPMFVWRVVRKYFKPDELKINTSAHVLRHSIATHLYHNGTPLHSIKNLLGHRSLKTTVLYLHFGPEHLKKVYTKAHPKEVMYNSIQCSCGTLSQATTVGLCE